MNAQVPSMQTDENYGMRSRQAGRRTGGRTDRQIDRQSFVCRSAIGELHRETMVALGVDGDVLKEVERLLGELQQLLVGISIMQVWPSHGVVKHRWSC
jgi:hypothetical protein